MKEEKQKAYAIAKAIARGEPVEEHEVERSQQNAFDGEGKIEVDAEGIASLSAKTLNAKLRVASPAAAAVETEEEDEAPMLLNPDLPNLLSVLDKADVILEVLDVRDPLAFRCKHIEEIAAGKGKKMLFVLNKIGRYSSIASLERSMLTLDLQIDVLERLLLPGVSVYERNSQRYCFVLLRHSSLKNMHRRMSPLLGKANQKYQSTMLLVPNR
jgi:hypothetical protein